MKDIDAIEKEYIVRRFLEKRYRKGIPKDHYQDCLDYEKLTETGKQIFWIDKRNIEFLYWINKCKEVIYEKYHIKLEPFNFLYEQLYEHEDFEYILGYWGETEVFNYMIEYAGGIWKSIDNTQPNSSKGNIKRRKPGRKAAFVYKYENMFVDNSAKKQFEKILSDEGYLINGKYVGDNIRATVAALLYVFRYKKLTKWMSIENTQNSFRQYFHLPNSSRIKSESAEFKEAEKRFVSELESKRSI